MIVLKGTEAHSFNGEGRRLGGNRKEGETPERGNELKIIDQYRRQYRYTLVRRGKSSDKDEGGETANNK